MWKDQDWFPSESSRSSMEFEYVGQMPARLVIFRGLGCPWPTPDDFNAVSHVLVPGVESLAVARYNTAELTVDQARNITLDNFLDQPFVHGFIQSLANVDAAGSTLAVESYSGGLFFATLVCAAANPDHRDSQAFFQALTGGKFSRIVAVNAAALGRKSKGNASHIIDYSMNHILPIPIFGSFAHQKAGEYYAGDSLVLSTRDGSLSQNLIREQMETRGRELFVCRNVISLSNNRRLRFPANMPVIYAVGHKNDNNVKHDKNVGFFDHLRQGELKDVLFTKTLITRCSEPHDIYSPKNSGTGLFEELRDKIR